MRLSKIKLAGFKSFVDPTVIHLPSNLVGIVGPNGCGKSNTIDAVRWVMGESSAKHLRGESMDDVIFTGSSARKPVGMAAVELFFDNSAGTLGGPWASYAEISVRREVTRDGQSRYYLNGTRCRRRDIAEVFLGTGLGPRSYAIIEQGMISRFIEAKPEELRGFLEEAAGISKYKERRKETESRMRQTRDNLTRLEDLRQELEKSLERLQRQANTAQRYKALKSEQRLRHAELLALRWQSHDRRVRDTEARLQEHRTRLEQLVAEQRAVEAGLEGDRQRHQAAAARLDSEQAQFYRIAGELKAKEQSIEHARAQQEQNRTRLDALRGAQAAAAQEIAADDALLDGIAEYLAELRPAIAGAECDLGSTEETLAGAEAAMGEANRLWEAFQARAAESLRVTQVERANLDGLERQIRGAEQRLERIHRERDELSTGDELSPALVHAQERRTACERALADIGARLQDKQAAQERIAERIEAMAGERDRLREAASTAAGRLASLEALQQSALHKDDSALQAWLDQQGLAEAPRLGELLRVEPQWSEAVETVLGEALESVAVDTLGAHARALSELGEGDVSLVDVGRGPGAIGVQARDRAGRLVAALLPDSPVPDVLGMVYGAESLDQALARQGELAPGESVITREGVWLGRDWARVRKGRQATSGILAREAEMRALRSEREGLDGERQRLEAALVGARDERDELADAIKELQAARTERSREHSRLESEIARLEERLEQRRRRVAKLSEDANELVAELRDWRVEYEATNARRTAAMVEIEAQEAERAELEQRRQGAQAALTAARAATREARAGLQRLQLRWTGLMSSRDGLHGKRKAAARRLAETAEERAELDAADEALGPQLTALAAERDTLLADHARQDQVVGSLREEAQALEERLRQQEQQRGQHERAAAQVREEVERLGLALQEHRVRRQTLDEELEGLAQQPATVLAELPPEADEAAWKAEVERLDAAIQRLGAINLAAIDEYASESERKAYLDRQHADLNEALAALETAIAKMDNETRERFRDIFNRVNTQLQRTFPKLFGGGSAQLSLTEEDLLSAGVAIMARPPGKRVTSIHLLSGGEKALTAVAMVFSIFALNPAPFCMLDEVDAPLDDANVGRYCEMVKEMAAHVQFIFITHNKVTMELAEQLMGVTMREPGVSRLVTVDVDEAARMAAV